jgi:hypothetical protein
MPSARQNDFLNLPFREKLEFLYGLPARQKRDLILSAPEAERLVQSFAPDTLFYTLKEIGVADAGDLLSLAIPEQVRWLFDLDCWDRDRPNFDRMREWIEALSEAGRKRMADGLMELDLELVALLLRRYLKVHRLDDPQTLPEAPSERFVQFDEHYLIEFVHHDTISPQISEFLESIFERDYNYFAGLMEEIYWGVEAELEEEAYRFRSARLSDRGFPNFFDAQNIFSYINPRNFFELRARYEPPNRIDSNEEDIVALDMALVAPGSDNSLFNHALTAGFAAQGKRQLRSEMAMVSNQVLVARAVDFGDLDAVRVAVEMTHDYLNLALEHLAGGDLGSAIEQLRQTHLKLLFQLGVSLTIDLRKQAELTVKNLGLDPKAVREIPYLDSPYREALAGFLERQPRFFAGLDGGGALHMRGFRSMRDLHMAYAVLEQIGALPDLFKSLLGIDLTSAAFRAEVAGREIRLSQVLLTAMARGIIDGQLSAEPLEATRLAALRNVIVAGGHGSKPRFELRRKMEELIAERIPPATRERHKPFIDSCLTMLEDELGGIDPKVDPDPRFIRSILIKRG